MHFRSFFLILAVVTGTYAVSVNIQKGLADSTKFSPIAAADDDPIEYAPVIQTKYGKVRGLVEQNGQVHVYQGIRFGEAKRFALPEPVKPWSDIYNATVPRNTCPQIQNYPNQSEDCLFLNVWRPSDSGSVPLPVMVWIYGGGFQVGSIFDSMYNGTYLASIGQVVMVSINYRLNAFGFLYAKDAASGNQGLYDQLLGLKWVQENIQQFGGDPKQVTIFGQSAGSMSVGALINSPLAEGLFNRAILESGYPSSVMAAYNQDLAWNRTLILAKMVECNQTEPIQLVDCLRNVSVENLINASLFSPSSPIFDDKFMPVSPMNMTDLAKRLSNRKIDIIFGITHDEGTNLIVSIFPKIMDDKAKFTREEIENVINYVMKEYRMGDPKPVIEHYTKGMDINNLTTVRLALSGWFGDMIINCPTMLFGKEMAKISSGKSFGYRLDDVPYKPNNWMGIPHGMEVPLVFGSPINPGPFQDITSLRMSVGMILAWSNFANTGRPGNLAEVAWNEVKSDSNILNYLSIAPESKMINEQQDFFSNCEKLWKNRLFID